MKQLLPTYWNRPIGYVLESGQRLATRWEKAVSSSISLAVARPAAGSPCLFKSADLRNVRRVSIRGFPKHLIFYRFDEQEVFVLRVVHGARDLERLLSQ